MCDAHRYGPDMVERDFGDEWPARAAGPFRLSKAHRRIALPVAPSGSKPILLAIIVVVSTHNLDAAVSAAASAPPKPSKPYEQGQE